MMQEVADAQEQAGFAVPEREQVGDGAKIAGYEPGNFPPRLRLSRAKSSYLGAELAWIMGAPWVDVELL